MPTIPSSVTHPIPDALITKAESLGACQEALEWLKEQPRTFEELVEQRGWAWWAVNAMATKQARDTYEAATKPAMDTYYAATYYAATKARDTYYAATKQAWDTYEAAKKQVLLAALLTLLDGEKPNEGRGDHGTGKLPRGTS